MPPSKDASRRGAARGGRSDSLRPAAPAAAAPGAVAEPVSFTLRGVRCQVVDERDNRGSASCDQGRPLGEVKVDGHRYLIRAEPPAPATAPVTELLTPRELHVVMLVGEGCSDKQIAERLHLSSWTISSYLRRIFCKLGVHTRAAMVARLLRDAGH